MTPARWFIACSWAVVPGWVLLIGFPRWKWTLLICRFIIPVLLALVYCGLVLTASTHSGSPVTLEQLMHSLDDPSAVVVGWIHYLVIDLFVGAWMIADSQLNGVPRYLVVPSVILTFFLAPAGLLSYLLTRRVLFRDGRRK